MSKSRVEKFEDKWIKKLDCMDETHTNRLGLSISDAFKLIKKLNAFADGTVEPPCSDLKKKVF